MKRTIIILSAIFSMIAASAYADNKTIEQRLADLEKTALSLPAGVFINGEVELYIDPDSTTNKLDTSAEIFLGFENEINHSIINWAGASTRFDSKYSLDRTKDNTIVEKQLGFGFANNTRLYLGETDAQRLGFAKTAKIGAPLIITESSSRIDHNEKVVLTYGGWQNSNEFEFDEYRLQRQMPYGVAIGYDPTNEVMYAGATVSLAGLAEVSYMRIAPETGSAQEGWSLGSQILRRYNIPVGFGIEVWDDKNTGTYTKDNRIDMGVMYNVNKEFMLTAHRVENDDIGTDAMYYGALYTVGGIQTGIYLHQVDRTNTWTGQQTEYADSIKATIKYSF